MALPKPPRKRWAEWIDKPWTRAARRRRNVRFRRWLWRHGYLSPNFTRAEARCKDGTDVPWSLRTNAQRHAFNLERFRHALGDRSMPILSWYRTPSWNAQVGGASQSRHMQADATDFTVQFVTAVGRSRWDSLTEKFFANHGAGSYPSGSRHLDSRPYRARWTSF